MSEPGKLVTDAILRHRASVESSRDVATALAAERDARTSAADTATATVPVSAAQLVTGSVN